MDGGWGVRSLSLSLSLPPSRDAACLWHLRRHLFAPHAYHHKQHSRAYSISLFPMAAGSSQTIAWLHLCGVCFQLYLNLHRRFRTRSLTNRKFILKFKHKCSGPRSACACSRRHLYTYMAIIIYNYRRINSWEIEVKRRRLASCTRGIGELYAIVGRDRKLQTKLWWWSDTDNGVSQTTVSCSAPQTEWE